MSTERSKFDKTFCDWNSRLDCFLLLALSNLQDIHSHQEISVQEFLCFPKFQMHQLLRYSYNFLPSSHAHSLSHPTYTDKINFLHGLFNPHNLFNIHVIFISFLREFRQLWWKLKWIPLLWPGHLHLDPFAQKADQIFPCQNNKVWPSWMKHII